jgi:predicted ATP-dependent endonuclease of OLD family
MRIKLSNIGPLNETNIDLMKDLIIFVGPNNSGKTYASYSIYGLYKYSKNFSESFLGFELPQLKIIPEIKDLLELGNAKIDLREIYRTYKANIIEIVQNNFKRNLPNIFATSSNYFNKCEIFLDLDDSFIEELLFKKGLKSGLQIGNSISIEILKESNSSNVRIILIREKDTKSLSSNSIIQRFVLQKLLDFILKNVFNDVYITPSERNAINIFSKELSVRRNILVDELLELKLKGKKERNIKLVEKRAQRYPLPIRDSLAVAEDLSNLQKNISDYKEFSKIIEKSILKGTIKISREGDVQFNPYRSGKKSISIHLTGSAVKSLSNLVFYFRHLAHKNDFIIIDEPELNLHPDTQRIMARIIVRFINAGFKVMISTHSDYIIRELNNLIMLSSRTEKALALAEKYEYETEEFLDPKRVAAYIFDRKQSRQISIDNTGISVSTIDEEINKLNQTSQDLYFSLVDAQ